LINDHDLLEHFLLSLHNTGYNDDLSENYKKDIWKCLLTKTYHAHISVVMDRFADATTGRFAATATTDPLCLELKIKTQKNTIDKVKHKMS